MLSGELQQRTGLMNLEEFRHLPLRGGFLLRRVAFTAEPMVDALERPALARTTIIGSNIEIEHCGINPDAGEISVSLYHEVLEGAAVAALHPPASVCELNEAGFEAAARECHHRLGTASPAALNQMLAEFGF